MATAVSLRVTDGAAHSVPGLRVEVTRIEPLRVPAERIGNNRCVGLERIASSGRVEDDRTGWGFRVPNGWAVASCCDLTSGRCMDRVCWDAEHQRSVQIHDQIGLLFEGPQLGNEDLRMKIL